MSLKDNGRRAAFYTLGCKVNQQETESLKALFRQRGYSIASFEDAADIYVINTCTVTGVSDKKSRQAVSRAHARNAGAEIVVVGCYAQRKPEELAALPGVRLIIGTQYRNELLSFLDATEGLHTAVEDVHGSRAFERLPSAYAGEPSEGTPATRTRAQVKIQDGCDRYCSYCIIPYARGPARSRTVEDIQSELHALGARSTAEVVLTGIHLMSYGKEHAALPSLAEIIRMAAETEGIGRIRLGSLDPAMVDDAFADALRELAPGKLCRQFHLSLQSGSDTVLVRMRRRYTADAYAAAVARMRRVFPGCAITTDIIAGFPGETEQEHRESVAFAARMGFSRMHVFPFSGREGTVAYTLPQQVGKAVKQQRARELTMLGRVQERAYMQSLIGSVQQVLPEVEKGGMLEGYTDTYVRVRLQSGAAAIGSLLPVHILNIDGGVLTGEAIL